MLKKVSCPGNIKIEREKYVEEPDDSVLSCPALLHNKTKPAVLFC